jgi:hypothetical protein
VPMCFLSCLRIPIFFLSIPSKCCFFLFTSMHSKLFVGFQFHIGSQITSFIYSYILIIPRSNSIAIVGAIKDELSWSIIMSHFSLSISIW